MDSVQVWCRVIRGLEWIAAAEAYLLPEVSNIKTRPRDLLFCCDTSEEAIARAYKQGELAHILLNLNFDSFSEFHYF